jgi:hypothetical protein
MFYTNTRSPVKPGRRRNALPWTYQFAPLALTLIRPPRPRGREEDVTEAEKMLLAWFKEDELRVCPNCGQKHLLPGWGSPNGDAVCVTCGVMAPE